MTKDQELFSSHSPPKTCEMVVCVGRSTPEEGGWVFNWEEGFEPILPQPMWRGTQPQGCTLLLISLCKALQFCTNKYSLS